VTGAGVLREQPARCREVTVQINQLERDNIPDSKRHNGPPVEYEHIP
jgi:hypothetical protein